MTDLHHQRGRGHQLAAILISVALTLIHPLGLVVRVQAQDSTRSSGVSFVRATLKSHGVMLQWQNSEADNLGFNVYRTQQGHRVKINGQIVGGAVFLGPRHVEPLGDRSYSWYDANGTADSTYEIESVGLYGSSQISNAVSPISNGKTSSSPDGVGETTATSHPAELTYLAPDAIDSATGQIEDQWTIAAQNALKILIKSDGWYRVTQQQMAAAGFSPTVDIRNLSLYTDGLEVAIRTNKDVDQFVSGDYIEFWGRAVDIPTADTRIYYLIAGNSVGKRIQGELRAEGSPDPTLLPSTVPSSVPERARWWPLVLTTNPPDQTSGDVRVSTRPNESPASPRVGAPRESVPKVVTDLPTIKAAKEATPAKTNATVPSRPVTTESTITKQEPNVASPAKPARIKKGKVRSKKKARRKAWQHRAHALATAAAAALSFDSTIQLKERYKTDTFSPVYYVSLLNGDAENYFGRVIAATPITQTLSLPNPETTADGPAKLQISLQGVLGQFAANHSINVDFNGTQVATYSFGPLDSLVRTINIPVAQIINGTNTVKFTKTSTGDVCLLDYIRFTYPHALKADNNSLRLNLRSTQSGKIDGFSAANVRLVDYTDPFNVKVTRPKTEATSSGYAIIVATGTPSKARRQLYAAFDTQFDQPAGLALNQPSSLNAATNSAELVIIAHKSLIPSVAPLVSLRQSQGRTVAVVDIDDVYDEFSYGIHTPQAVRDFLFRASQVWTGKPKYVIFLGDADLDPRNYEGVGNFDLVPTKLIDATYNETSSDDWLTDFNNDGIADIPTGRLPVRTPAEANLAISKIVGFSPTNAPQTALLVADDPTGYYFNFEIANDEVQALLPSTMTVVRVNRRTDPNSHNDIVNTLNTGVALVNYSGHGNVNTWTGANIFTTPDAAAATNGNKLPLVLVMNCLNGYFQDPRLEGIAEGFLKAQNGGAFGVFASSGETVPDGQHQMSNKLYQLLYGSPPTAIALGDAIKIAKAETADIDVRRTWIFFGDPSMSIR